MTRNIEENLDSQDFLIDSGASDHIVNNDEYFIEWTNLNPPIKIEVAKKGETILATKRGTIKVETNTGSLGTLENVLYSKDLPQNLLSVKRMNKAGYL